MDTSSSVHFSTVHINLIEQTTSSILLVVSKRRIIVVIRKHSRCLLLHRLEQHRRILLWKETYRSLAKPADPCGNPFGDMIWKTPNPTSRYLNFHWSHLDVVDRFWIFGCQIPETTSKREIMINLTLHFHFSCEGRDDFATLNWNASVANLIQIRPATFSPWSVQWLGWVLETQERKKERNLRWSVEWF